MTRILAVHAATDDSMTVTFEDDDGRLHLETLDDIESVQQWGGGMILRFKTRDPVIVRADRTVHTLVAA